MDLTNTLISDATTIRVGIGRFIFNFTICDTTSVFGKIYTLYQLKLHLRERQSRVMAQVLDLMICSNVPQLWNIRE